MQCKSYLFVTKCGFSETQNKPNNYFYHLQPFSEKYFKSINSSITGVSHIVFEFELFNKISMVYKLPGGARLIKIRENAI